MKAVELSADYLDAFKQYLYCYRYDHDESFLYDDDIKGFKIDEKQITRLLVGRWRHCGRNLADAG